MCVSSKTENLGLLKSIILYVRVMQYFIGYRVYVFMLLNFLSVAAESFGLLLFIPFFKTIDLGARGSDKISKFVYGCFDLLGLEVTVSNTLSLLVSAFVLKAIVIFAINVYRQYVCSKLGYDLRENLISKYSYLDYRYCAQRGSGFFGNLVASETNSAITAINALSRTMTCAITTLILVVTVIFVHPQLSIITALAGLFNLLVLRFTSKLTQHYSRQASRESSRLHGLIVELLHSVKYLKATSQFLSINTLIRRTNRNSASIELRHTITNAASNAITEPLLVALISLVIYYFIVIKAQSFGIIVVPLLFFYRCMQEAGYLQANWMAVCNASGAYLNVYRTLEDFDKHKENQNIDAQFSFQRDISFRDVSFSYSSLELFSNLNVSIRKNSSVALVGASGAGKTTFVDLLTGILKPTKGEIRIDDAPLENLSLQKYRSKIGYVVQDPVIFSDTVANNISMNLDTTPDSECLERVKKVAKLSHVDEFVQQMPDGYFTQVGERGYRLSGGQKQRLAIARELYKNPEILIFDESTSALDPNSEEMIQESVANLRGSITVLIISHRLSTVSCVDRILVIDQGQIIEDGTLEELLNQEDSHFRKVYSLKQEV